MKSLSVKITVMEGEKVNCKIRRRQGGEIDVERARRPGLRGVTGSRRSRTYRIGELGHF